MCLQISPFVLYVEEKSQMIALILRTYLAKVTLSCVSARHVIILYQFTEVTQNSSTVEECKLLSFTQSSLLGLVLYTRVYLR